MMDIPTAENIKHPKLALIAGLLIGLSLGAGASWTARTTIDEAQFKMVKAVNADLQRQVSKLQESSQANDAELAQLGEQLSEISPQRREAEAQHRGELEAFIQHVDKEIALKKKELAAALPVRRAQMRYLVNCRPDDEQCHSRSAAPVKPPDPPAKSAFAIQIEKELDALAAQRTDARKRLIDLVAQ